MAALDEDRIAALVPLLDAPETDEHEGAHHARDLAAHLGMKLLFCRTFRRGVGQSRELVGEGWLASTELPTPHLLCGDLNAVPHARTCRRFASKLRDAQRALVGHRPRATFTSRLPLLRLDHVFVSKDLRVRAVSVRWNGRSRRASDHLPLIVDLEIRETTT